MRAFLSHSSEDKDFVAAVASDLGRQHCVFDQFSFRTAEDFRDSIRQGLQDTTLFVLFASAASLASDWVNFELDEAELRLIQREIQSVLVVFVSDDIGINDLPQWLRRTRVTVAHSPKAAAREVQRCMQALAHKRQRPVFVGRQKERQDAEEKIFDLGGNACRSFFVTGLTGIGRRTFLTRLSDDLLGLSTHVVIRVEAGETLKELATKLAEHAAAYVGSEELRAIVNHIDEEEENLLLLRITRYCKELIRQQQLPVFYDDGGLIDDDGYLRHPFAAILTALEPESTTYLAFVTNRTPKLDGIGSSPRPPVVRIPPLSSPDSVRLLGRLNERAKRGTLTSSQLRDIADYLGGYPPSAYYAIALMQIYGSEVLVVDKSRLVAYRASSFVSYLDKRGILTKTRHKILSVLSYYSPLPLRVLGDVVVEDKQALVRDLMFLIDCSLVIPDDNGNYAIADPVVEAVHRITSLGDINHHLVATSLADHLDDATSDDRDVLRLARSLFRANRLCGVTERRDKNVRMEIGLVSDLVRLQVDSYHARDYENALNYGRLALDRNDASLDAHAYVVRSFAQLGRREEAVAHLDRYRTVARLKDVYFLQGFVERISGDLAAAKAAFEESLRRGRGGLAVHREIAHVYFLLGDTDGARRHVEIALKNPRGNENRFLVDLQIQIAIRQRDEDTVREKLTLLEQVDSEGFFDHRNSTAELAFGNIQEAYASIHRAIEKTRPPTAAMVAQAARCSIEMSDFESAESCLTFLRRDFKHKARRLMPNLECRYEIARGKFADALSMLGEPRSDDSVRRLLRKRALEGLLSNSDSAEEIRGYEAELHRVNASIESEGGAADFEIEIR